MLTYSEKKQMTEMILDACNDVISPTFK